MKNRLQFSSKQIVYEWEKYNAIRNYAWTQYIDDPLIRYIWKSYNTIGGETKYLFDKYQTFLDTAYYSWNKRKVQSATYYKWIVSTIIRNTETQVSIDYSSYREIVVDETQITLYAEPNLSSSSTTYYYPDDYNWDYEDYEGYLYYNNKWYYVERFRKSAQVGTEVGLDDLTTTEITREEEGSPVDEIWDTINSGLPTNAPLNGLWYRKTNETRYSFYVAQATETTETPTHRGLLPQLDRATGTFTFTEGEGPYGWNDDNTYYYVITDKTFKITTAQNATEADELTNYIGLSAMNGSYYQILKGSSYIKGPKVGRVEADSRDAYTEGRNDDGYWYEYAGTSEASGYIFKKYNNARTTRITYVWNKYKPLYYWKKYDYVESSKPSTTSLDKIAWCRIATTDSRFTNVIFQLKCGQAYSDFFTIALKQTSINVELPQGGSTIATLTIPSSGKLTIQPKAGTYGTATELQSITISNENKIKLYLEGNVLYMYVEKSYTKGTYQGEVSSEDINAYPEGVQDGFYYEYDRREVGSQIGQITSLNPNEIVEGWNGDIYYMAMSPIEEQIDSRGSYVGEVETANRNDFEEGKKNDDGFWYVFDRVKTNRTKGDYIGLVYDEDPDRYPPDGMDENNIWYEKQAQPSIIHRPSTAIGTVSSMNETEYPTDGEKDGYYYRRSENDDFYTQGDEYYGVIQDPEKRYPMPEGAVNEFYFVYKGTNYLNLGEIRDDELIDGVKYEKCVNDGDELKMGLTAGASINFTTTQQKDYMNAQCDWYVQFLGDEEETHIGAFQVVEAHREKGKIKITALDAISKFDKVVDGILPMRGMTPTQIADTLGRTCGVSINFDSQTVNREMICNVEYDSDNISGRVILGHLAEFCGGWAEADKAGNVIIRSYKEKATEEGQIVIDNTKYSTLEIADYQVAPVDKVINKDMIKTKGNGTNTYVIEGNPFFAKVASYNADASLTNFYNVVHNISYTPVHLVLYKDFGVDCGDIIIVDGETVYIQSKSIDMSGVKLEATGNERRNITYNSALDGVRRELNSVRNEVNKVEEDVQIVAEVARQAQIDIQETEIKIDGKVSFNDLAGTGRHTVIDGDLITTGQVVAECVDSRILNVASGGAIMPLTPVLGETDFRKGMMIWYTHPSSRDIHEITISTEGVHMMTIGAHYQNQLYTTADRIQMEYDNQYTGSHEYIGVDDRGCYSSSAISVRSDRDVKEDINDLNDEEAFMKLRPRTFKYKGEKGTHTGFIAQEIQEAMGDYEAYVEYDKPQNGAKCGVRYEELIALNTMMIQKQAKEIEELKAEIEKLKGETK